MRALLILFCLIALIGAGQPASAQKAGYADLSLARKVLNRYLPPSFRHDVEYCGFILRGPDGVLYSTPAVRGGVAECRLPQPKSRDPIISSWHTHAAFNQRTYSEVPSLIDLDGEMRDNRHGWVGTPGGRFWLVDGRAGEVRLICGPGCLKQDRKHIPGFEGIIPSKLNRDELSERFEER